MKTVLKSSFVVLVITLFCGQNLAARQPSANSLALDATDARKVITRDMGRGLLLRVVKESSVSQKDFGWRLEVVRKPYRRNSKNLLYQNKLGVLADASQVYAWHVAEQQFPNERELKVNGHPYVVKVSLVEPKVEGSGPEARFVSGKLLINWERKE